MADLTPLPIRFFTEDGKELPMSNYLGVRKEVFWCLLDVMQTAGLLELALATEAAQGEISRPSVENLRGRLREHMSAYLKTASPWPVVESTLKSPGNDPGP